jgi:hypothetical protein
MCGLVLSHVKVQILAGRVNVLDTGDDGLQLLQRIVIPDASVFVETVLDALDV